MIANMLWVFPKFYFFVTAFRLFSTLKLWCVHIEQLCCTYLCVTLLQKSTWRHIFFNSLIPLLCGNIWLVNRVYIVIWSLWWYLFVFLELKHNSMIVDSCISSLIFMLSVKFKCFNLFSKITLMLRNLFMLHEYSLSMSSQVLALNTGSTSTNPLFLGGRWLHHSSESKKSESLRNKPFVFTWIFCWWMEKILVIMYNLHLFYSSKPLQNTDYLIRLCKHLTKVHTGILSSIDLLS